MQVAVHGKKQKQATLCKSKKHKQGGQTNPKLFAFSCVAQSAVATPLPIRHIAHVLFCCSCIVHTRHLSHLLHLCWRFYWRVCFDRAAQSTSMQPAAHHVLSAHRLRDLCQHHRTHRGLVHPAGHHVPAYRLWTGTRPAGPGAAIAVCAPRRTACRFRARAGSRRRRRRSRRGLKTR